jgi:oxygen-independent coproporphyrinogen III oxidase
MAGVYIHIPFCRKACHYCNFHFSTSLKLKNEFLHALLKEIEITASTPEDTRKETSGYLKGEMVDTIYFGGGTPSLLSEEELTAIFNQLHRYYSISATAEVTLEANPDDITQEKLEAWKKSGINRLSIGIQSFFDDDLVWMNRAHTSEQSIAAIQLSKAAGFHNLTIDLIYGTPGLTDEKWKQNVDIAIHAGIPHLSCYGLTVEPSTALDKLIRQKKVEDIDQEKQARQYLLLMQWLGAAGYEHYEISNFAKPGLRSRHNTSYWQGKTYLGLGPSAHSFDGRSRRWNISNNAMYIQSVANNELPVESEELTVTQQINEYIMTALRTSEGVNLNEVEKRFGTGISLNVELSAKKYIESGKIQQMQKRLVLTMEGKLYADGIASELFL